MSEVSNFYGSFGHIYRNSGGQESDRSKNGDVIHTVYKDGKPVASEVIRVEKKKKDPPQGRRIQSDGRAPQERSPRQAHSNASDKDKFRKRLLQAAEQSETLWSEKNGILISYQGGDNFLVKTYGPSNRLISEKKMTLPEIMESHVAEIRQAGWQKM